MIVATWSSARTCPAWSGVASQRRRFRGISRGSPCQYAAMRLMSNMSVFDQFSGRIVCPNYVHKSVYYPVLLKTVSWILWFLNRWIHHPWMSFWLPKLCDLRCVKRSKNERKAYPIEQLSRYQGAVARWARRSNLSVRVFAVTGVSISILWTGLSVE